MQPRLPSTLDDHTLDRLERYFVDGEQALSDPLVANAVATNSTLVHRLRHILLALRVRTHSTTEQSLAHALQRAGLRPANGRDYTPALPAPLNHSPAINRRYLWPLFAVLAFIALGTYTIRSAHERPSDALTASHNTTYTSTNGQRTNITLPDGSTVLLNVASRLEIPSDFGAGHRTVLLQGEALFNVTHLEGQPFTVMTGATSTRVLGTTFVVRRYHTDTTTTVAVQDGKVAVQSVVVPARWQANIGTTGAVQLQPLDSSRLTFAAGILTLDDMSLPDAITELSRWYDVDIRLASPELAGHRISATCPMSSIDNLVAILEFTLHVRVERIGRTLTLYPIGV